MRVVIGNQNLPADVIVHEAAHHTPVSVFEGETVRTPAAASINSKRIPIYGLEGRSMYAKHYFGFLNNFKGVWGPRAKSVAFWGPTLTFWAWYALLPHSNMVLRRVFLNEQPED